jgi:hypothetical protein
VAHEIQTAKVREKLAIRINEPYWRTLARGRALGFRKIAKPAEGYWIARMRDDESGKKYAYSALGATSELDYEAATTKAEEWFRLKKDGIKTDEVVTVGDACRAYVTERRASKSAACSHDANKRFERTVYEAPFGRQTLEKLNTAKICTWRDGLGLSPGATNRTLTALKAALNLAIKRKFARTALREELRNVEHLATGGKRRELYLDMKQRRALLKAAKGAVRDLIEAAALTGARAGELTRATVAQFNGRAGKPTMRFFSGKQLSKNSDGTREVLLSQRAAKLLRRVVGGKGEHRLSVRQERRHPVGTQRLG